MGAVVIPRSAPEILTVMTTANDSFHKFLTRLQARDGDAARELFRRFTGQLITLARRRLAGPLRHKVDSEGVVKSTYKIFLRRYDEGDLDFANWNSLGGLLTLITLRKCADRVAYHRAERHDAAREVPAPPSPLGPGSWARASRTSNGAANQSRSGRPGQGPNGTAPGRRPFRGTAGTASVLNPVTLADHVWPVSLKQNPCSRMVRVVSGPGPARSMLWSLSPRTKEGRLRHAAEAHHLTTLRDGRTGVQQESGPAGGRFAPRGCASFFP
jgi:hypothetical protein